MPNKNCLNLVVAALLIPVISAASQDRPKGTALVRIADTEYTIPIECNDAARPELGFYTEPSRITRESTGRTSGVRLNVRPWKDTGHLVISLDRYVAWVPAQPSSGGVLTMTIDMSPVSSPKDGMPVALTYDMWMQGERPAGLDGVFFTADCSRRDPAAPAMRNLQTDS